MTFFRVLCGVLAISASALAYEAHFARGNCHLATCYVGVEHPGNQQVFYEVIREGKIIVYELMDTLGDNPFFVEVYTPAGQGRKMCDGAQISVLINKQAVQVWDAAAENRQGTLEPFTQLALVRLGDAYSNGDALDRKDRLEVHMAGPAHDTDCHMAVAIGKTRRPSATALLEYPVVTFRAWSWGWKPPQYNGVVFPFTGVAFLIAFLLYSCRGASEWAAVTAHLALAVYMAVFLTRAVFMMSASSAAADADPTPHLIALGICLVDFLFLLAVAVFVLDKWFAKISDAVLCCSLLCCPCRLFFACLEEQGSRAASVFVLIVAFASLFAFSAGFYLGPALLTLSAVIALAPASQFSHDIY